MLEITLAALLLLHPSPGKAPLRDYAQHITTEAARVDIDPLLVVALIHREGRWDPRARSGKGDFGLMQIRARVFRRFRANPGKLYDYKINITVGIETLAMWRSYHQKNCRGKKHDWWAHYQHGNKVYNNRSAERVERLRQWLYERTRRADT